MGQKYPTDKQPYRSEIIEGSLWKCCVASTGNRKKLWEDEDKVWDRAKEVGGIVYECLFNPNTYHITTHPHNKQLRKITGELNERISLVSKEMKSIQSPDRLAELRKTKKKLKSWLYYVIKVKQDRVEENRKVHEARFGRGRRREY